MLKATTNSSSSSSNKKKRPWMRKKIDKDIRVFYFYRCNLFY
ncbi:MAG: hypothetical protein ABJB76_04100 [Candidatus Nitrosocosmicus sp.]